jgi:hypothetical protein
MMAKKLNSLLIKQLYFGLILVFITQGNLLNASSGVTKEDYHRAAMFQTKMRDMVYQLSVQPGWIPDNKGFWFLEEN